MITLRVALTDRRFTTTAAVEQLVRTTVERVTALRGVISAAATRTLPLESDWRTSIRIVDRPFQDTSPVIVSYRIVSPEYFNVLHIPIVRGRAPAGRIGRVDLVPLGFQEQPERFEDVGLVVGDEASGSQRAVA